MSIMVGSVLNHLWCATQILARRAKFAHSTKQTAVVDLLFLHSYIPTFASLFIQCLVSMLCPPSLRPM